MTIRTHSEAECIAELLFDQVTEEGASEGYAHQMAHEVFTFLERDPHYSGELFAVKLVDHAGAPHACIVAKLEPHSVLLFSFDIRKMRTEARRRLLDDLRLDLACDHDAGTEI